MENYLVQNVSHYCNISVDRCSPIKERQIEYYDLTFVLSGRVTYYADGETIVLCKNDAILLKPGTLRSRSEGTQPVHYVSFNFQLLPGAVLDFPPFIPNCISADIRTLLSAFSQSHLSQFDYSRQKATNILNYILYELTESAVLMSCNPHIRTITKYIGEHITEPLSLAGISRVVGLSKEHIAHLFKKEVGMTLTEYVNRQKMLSAKELIQSGQLQLTDIAEHLGYRNYSYFSRVFKRYVDVSPLDMRKKR